MPAVSKNISNAIRNAYKSPVSRQTELDVFMSMKPKEIERTDAVSIWWSREWNTFVALERATNDMIYSMEYEIEETAAGPLLMQVSIWRDERAKTLYPGLVQHIVFDVILEGFDGIITDPKQSVEGRDMWKRFLQRAVKDGLPVGFLLDNSDLTKAQVNMYDRSKGSFQSWLTQKDAWNRVGQVGSTTRFRRRLLFILSRHRGVDKS